MKAIHVEEQIKFYYLISNTGYTVQ